MEFFSKIVSYFNKNSTKVYLLLANIVLVVFGIWFSNAGLLPFSNLGDFAVFSLLSIILALYRPGWTFAFFIGALVLENINLAPKDLGLALRPYQFFAIISLFSLALRFLLGRLNFSLPKWRWYDALGAIFVLGGLLSAFAANNKGMSFKQAIVALSFVVLYFLVRVFVQSWDDLKRIVPFFISSAVIVMAYGILQNILFLQGSDSFEVMPGRPNSTFTEPDWFGIYITFIFAVLFTWLYPVSLISEKNKDAQIFNFQLSIFNQLLNVKIFKQIGVYFFLVILFITLILTVSRSAWLGAGVITIGFLIAILIDGSIRISQWKWKIFFHTFLLLSVVIISSVALVYVFRLTNFQVGNRAISTGGLQKITIACSPEPNSGISNGSMIENIDELSKYGCRHINLEDIEKEKESGNVIMEVRRPDPTVNIRAEIYRKSIDQIKQNPILGIGWGNIGSVLGKDENGAGLNASNIFLEVYLGSGLLGIVSFVILLLWIFMVSVKHYLNQKKSNKTAEVFILLGWAAIVIPNLFNSGIFLGFLWAYLAVAVSLLNKNADKV